MRAIPVYFLLLLLPLSANAYDTVTDARLRAPEPSNWLQYRGNYAGWGYSELDGIDRVNVAQLASVWSFSTGSREAHQAPPLVNGDFMFITTPANEVLALDARRGELRWRYRHEIPEDLFQLHPTNRGVALYGDRVYLATVDARLVALDAKTGEVLFDREVEDYSEGYYMTLAPLVAEEKVMVGVSGGELGVRGFVAAFDAETGDLAWKTHTIPLPGEPGGDSWPEGKHARGGVPVWVTGTYDIETRIAYWGTGNAGPWIGDQRPGDNLYANSVLALDVATGAIRGHHQYHWNGSWDWDEVSAPILAPFRRGDAEKRGLIHPGRNGYLWFLERRGGPIGFVDAKPYVRQNVFTGLDPETGRPSYDPERKPATGKTVTFCPSAWGGKDWPPAAYSPRTRMVYIPANDNHCSVFKGQPVEEDTPPFHIGVDISVIELDFPEGEPKTIGELQAWHVDRAEEVWTQTFPRHNWGPVLVTAGDVVFAGGTNDRYFRAFDAETGKILWQQRTNSGVLGVPVSYAIDGVQYVAVQSGWGVDAERKQEILNRMFDPDTHVPQGGVLWVFALKKP